MSEIKVCKYEEEFEEKWDEFVFNKSINGTFLQSRKFIKYHPQDRFEDNSLLFFKGNEIVGCILANSIIEEEKKYFFSHKGTTFGGLIVSENVYNAKDISEIMDCFENYLKEEGYASAYLKQTPSIFSKHNTELIDYFLYQRGFKQYSELNFFLELETFDNEVENQFTSSKRRDYRYSLKNELLFKELTSKEEIEEFYGILVQNHDKLGLPTIHTLEDLYDLKYERFNEKIRFYGVYFFGKMIAGTMLFDFNNDVVHTQYLASDEAFLKMYSMDFLIRNIIYLAKGEGKKYFTFGICTEDRGKYLNLGLSRFKEGFGSTYTINKSFEKEYK